MFIWFQTLGEKTKHNKTKPNSSSLLKQKATFIKTKGIPCQNGTCVCLRLTLEEGAGHLGRIQGFHETIHEEN